MHSGHQVFDMSHGEEYGKDRGMRFSGIGITRDFKIDSRGDKRHFRDCFPPDKHYSCTSGIYH